MWRRATAHAETDEEAQHTSIAGVRLKQDTLEEEDRRRFSWRRPAVVTVIFGDIDSEELLEMR
jgi:hypothetical protein